MDPLDELKLELQRIPWFRELQIKHLDMIAGITQLRNVKAGEVLFREGDRAEYIYIVLSGRIALDMAAPPRGKVRFHTAEMWEVIGWSSATPVVRQRTASATAVVLVRHAEDPRPLIADGEWHGEILPAARGEGGFGYDPLFWVESEQASAAELAPARKNQLSHRGQALRHLLRQLQP